MNRDRNDKNKNYATDPEDCGYQDKSDFTQPLKKTSGVTIKI
jgi:hypothetical protein